MGKQGSKPSPKSAKKKPKKTALAKAPAAKKSKKKAALTKAPSTHVVPSQDPVDDDHLVRQMTADEIRGDNNTRALAVLRASMVQATPAQQLAYGALLCILDVDSFVVVRDDDGTIWPFVPGGDRWRGAVRRHGDFFQESWFLPDEERIVWETLS
jgi:hypothetical protein